VVADRLAAHGGEAIAEDEFIRECLGVGQQYHLQRRIVSGEAVSAELFKTGLKLAANRGLVEAGGPEVKAGRASFARELHEVLRRLEILASWDRTHRLRREGVT
jgi:glycerol-3-phosphate O-acyltransferase